MRKKALLALLLVMTMLLSGCALIVKDEIKDNNSTIIQLGDKTVTKAAVKEAAEQELASTAYMYKLYGYSYDTTDPDNIAAAQESAIKALKEDLVLSAKAAELGLDKLSDEEKTEAENAAKEDYDYAASFAKSSIEGADEMDEETLAKAVEEALLKEGASMEKYLESETKQIVEKHLKEDTVKDVAVTDEEIKEDYDSKVEADKTSYEGKAGSWATAANNGTKLYYTPAGVRRVKQILTKFKDEDQTAITEANTAVTEANTAVTAAQAKIDTANETLGVEDLDEETKAKAQADLEAAQKELEEANAKLDEAKKAVDEATDKAFKNIDEETDAILASLAEGADWQTLMDEKNQDPGMKSNEKGYAVAADMTGFDSAFVEAAMALEKVGDYSGKVKGTSYGYYIIRYESDEAEGPIALDEVKESISSSLLTTKQNNYYNECIDKWVEESGIKVDLNALKD